MGTVLWVVGEPGVGKTSVVRPMLGGPLTLVMRPKWTVGAAICAAGHYTGGKFDGSDTLPIGDIKMALAYWAECLRDKPLTVLDGDKLSTANALALVRDAGATVRCVHLTAPAELVAARRARRGTSQDPAWVRGRRTKASNFAKLFSPGELLELTCWGELEGVTQAVRGFATG